ncbi:MAG: U32 family peptidase [Clostridiales bacterium]|nr:U32 family peptidase [Clostridiales bacterium]
MTIEVLAPAGGDEQLIAAVRAGADAVYLGTGSFNARRNAANFDADALKKAVSYCRGRGVKVHVTCNTLVTDRELPLLYEEIKNIAASGADAVIVQDLAVAAMFREHCPDMPLHASTQMTIHSAEGAMMAKELGFERAVLAREVSLDEIRAIHERVDIELEAFVHGALCMSVSGQCYLSAMLGGRSGNRGLCAQPCRLNFNSKGREYALSLKDLSLIEYVRELEEAGVSSLKIEGRMKRPEYVAAATSACRAAVNGEKPDMDSLKAVFSRSGFTDGYFSGRRGMDMFGIRTKDDVQASAAVLGDIAALYRNERQSVPVAARLSLRSGKPALLSVTDGKHIIELSGDVPEAAKIRGMDVESVRRSLEKMGGTPFFLDTLEAEIDEGLYLSPSKLNALRREALEQLLKKRSEICPKMVIGDFQPLISAKRSTQSELRLRFETAEQIFPEADEAGRIYLPYSEINEALIRRFGSKLIAELPRFIPEGDGEKITSRLKTMKELGLENGCAGTIGDIEILRNVGLKIFGGFSLNALNSKCVDELEHLGISDVTLSFENSMKNAAYIGGRSVGILAYGYLPLMLFRSCPARGKNGCMGCSGRDKIKDRNGTEFTVMCGGRKYSTLLNSLPLYIGDKELSGVDFKTLYYTVESKERCRSVYRIFREGAEFDDKRTNGLYYRELL